MTVSGDQLKMLCRARLKTVKILIDAEDWDAAAYMMGYALETALKSAACKALKLQEYPHNTGQSQIDGLFMTHRFDRLLIVSGLSDLFALAGPPVPAKNWSEFVQEFEGDWVTMRYNPNAKIKFDKIKVRRLYKNLYTDTQSILRTITVKRRW